MKIIKLMATIIALVFTFSIDVNAMNANLSRWLKNLSGTSTATERESYFNFFPEVVVSGNTIHVLWVHLTPDQSTMQLIYRRSLDKGKTWEEKKILSSHTDDVFQFPHRGDTFRRMAVSGNNVHIFQSYYNGILRYFRSTNGGATFETREFTIVCLEHIYASAAGSKVTVGYRSCRTDGTYFWGNTIKVMTSEDNGLTFKNHTAFATDEDYALRLWDMQVSGDKIYMVYTYSYSYPGGGYATGNKLYFSASTNRGINFVTNVISVPSATKDSNGVGVHKTFNLQAVRYVPKIAIDGSNVYVVWCGLDSENTMSLFFRRSTNDGISFEEVLNLTKTTIPGREPAPGQDTVAAKAGKVYVLFLSGLQNYGTDTAVEFMRSLNKGIFFEPPKRINNSYDSSVIDFTRGGVEPLMKLDPFDLTGSKIHVIATPMTYSYSSDSGANFKGPVRLDPYKASSLRNTQMDISSGGVAHVVAIGYITWYSEGLFGDVDVFYRSYNPIVPQKSPTGNNALSILQKQNLGDGTGDERYDVMQIPASSDVNFTDAMTAEAWIKPNRQDGDEAYFVVKLDPGPVSYKLGQWRNGFAEAIIGTTDGTYLIRDQKPLPNGKWAHVAMTYNANGGANNFRLYVNGDLVASTTATGTLLSNSKGPLAIGGTCYSDGYAFDILRGIVIDELRLWNRALSQEEIKENMRKTLTGTEPNLVAYFPFNEPITMYGTVRDVTGRGNDGTLVYKESLTTGVEFALRLIAPNGGEKIPAGSAYEIMWEGPSKAVKFKIYYSTDNKQTWNYITEVGSVGKYSWQVPAQDGNKAQSFVRVEAFDSAGNKIQEDSSDKAFMIEVLRLKNPNGGETLKAGTVYTITWDTYALTKQVAKVQIQYSSDGGSTWKNIKTLTGNPGQYNWTVPNTPSTNCKVRVVLKDSAGNNITTDASDKVFTIAP